MSAYPFASSEKVAETLGVLGTSNIATTQQTLLQQILVACGASRGIPQPEIVTVATVSNAGFNLHNKYFTVYDGLASVGLYGSMSPTTQRYLVTCLAKVDYVNAGAPARYIAIWTSLFEFIVFWFNTGVETGAPIVSGATAYYQVSVVAAISSLDVAGQLGFVMNDTAGITVDNNGDGTLNVFASENGPLSAPAFDIGTVTITRTGRLAATPPAGHSRTIPFNLIESLISAINVAQAVSAAVNTDAAFSATRISNVVTITRNSNGACSDATAGDSGFTVTVTQQGA